MEDSVVTMPLEDVERVGMSEKSSDSQQTSLATCFLPSWTSVAQVRLPRLGARLLQVVSEEETEDLMQHNEYECMRAS